MRPAAIIVRLERLASTMKSTIRALCPVMLLLFFCGCGQSGPLYLPGNPSEVQQAPASQDEGDEDEADNER